VKAGLITFMQYPFHVSELESPQPKLKQTPRQEHESYSIANSEISSEKATLQAQPTEQRWIVQVVVCEIIFYLERR
jgi:hypothetical protein